MYSYEFTINAQTLSEASRICRQMSQTILDNFPRRSGTSPTSSFDFKRIVSDDQPILVVVPDERDRSEGEKAAIARLRSNDDNDREFTSQCLAAETKIIELALRIKKNSHADTAVYLWKALEDTVTVLTAKLAEVSENAPLDAETEPSESIAPAIEPPIDDGTCWKDEPEIAETSSKGTGKKKKLSEPPPTIEDAFTNK